MNGAWDHVLGGFFCILFAFTGLIKITHWRAFGNHMQGMGIAKLAALAATVVVPLLELCLAVLVVALPYRALTYLILVSVLGVFTVFVAWALRSRRVTTCYCFGREGRLSIHAVLRNIVLIGLALVALPFASAAPHGGLAWQYQFIFILQSITAFALFWVGMRVTTIGLALSA